MNNKTETTETKDSVIGIDIAKMVAFLQDEGLKALTEMPQEEIIKAVQSVLMLLCIPQKTVTMKYQYIPLRDPQTNQFTGEVKEMPSERIERLEPPTPGIVKLVMSNLEKLATFGSWSTNVPTAPIKPKIGEKGKREPITFRQWTGTETGKE